MRREKDSFTHRHFIKILIFLAIHEYRKGGGLTHDHRLGASLFTRGAMV